jgi:hypothetical protein
LKRFRKKTIPLIAKLELVKVAKEVTGKTRAASLYDLVSSRLSEFEARWTRFPAIYVHVVDECNPTSTFRAIQKRKLASGARIAI